MNKKKSLHGKSWFETKEVFPPRITKWEIVLPMPGFNQFELSVK